MTSLVNTETGQVLTRFVNFKETHERLLTVQQALDGTEYMTRFGAPFVAYELTLYVNMEGKAALTAAADNLTLLKVNVRQGRFTGRIKELGDFELLAAGWHKVEAVLSSESEVTDR